MTKQFKEGDKIRIIQDYSTSKHSGRTGAVGEFVAYTHSNYHKMSGYNYIVNLPGVIGLICADIELVEEEFKIPEKWCINVSDFEIGAYLINNFHKRNEMHWYKRFPNGVKYFNYNGNIPHFWSSEKNAGYMEVTFEQFKKYILKQETMKPIIGWKLKEGLWLDSHKESVIAGIAKIGLIHGDRQTEETINKTVSDFPNVIENFKKAGVLEAWFIPVYEEETVTIGTYTSEKIEGGVKFGCQSFDRADVRAIYRLFDKEINASLTIQGQTITKEMVEKLLKMF